jgi:hypothetical protein
MVKKIMNFEQFGKMSKAKTNENVDDEDFDENYEGEEEDEEDEDIDYDGYSEVSFKMDKYMPDDEEAQREYHGIFDDENLSREEKIEELVSFFQNNANEEIMYRYMPKDGTLRGFAEYLLDQDAE